MQLAKDFLQRQNNKTCMNAFKVSRLKYLKEVIAPTIIDRRYVPFFQIIEQHFETDLFKPNFKP